MSELVLAINRSELFAQGIYDSGLCTFDLYTANQMNYALLPRDFADNKSPEAITLGNIFAQILSYVVVKNDKGQILTYQRKGKEKGLLGKWSIGVGGHISQQDFFTLINETHSDYPALMDLVMRGTERELEEELGIDIQYCSEMFNTSEDFAEAIKFCLASYDDPTSSVHVGLPFIIEVEQSDITFDPKEFNNLQWLDPKELVYSHKQKTREYETWSRILIDNFERFTNAE